MAASDIVPQSVYPDTDAQLLDEYVIAVCEEVNFTSTYVMRPSFREVRGGGLSPNSVLFDYMLYLPSSPRRLRVEHLVCER